MGFIYFLISIIGGVILFSFIADDFGKEELQNRLDKLQPNKKKKEKISNKSAIVQIFDELLNPFVSKNVEKKANTKSIKYMLTQAGINADDDAIFKHMLTKFYYMIALAIVSAIVLILLKPSPLLGIALPLIFIMSGFKYPDIKLKKAIKYRMTEIQYGLADSLDLLTICVEAGLGLDAALGRVANEMDRSCPVLALEFSRVGKDILAGIPRQEAFRNLSARNSVEDLQSFVALLVQTDKLGTSIAQSLRTFSDTLRTRRRQRVETLSSQASVKMVIPLVLFIMPAMFMILMGPAAINMISVFSNSNLAN